MAVRVKKLTDSIGAEIQGVDLRQKFDDTTFKEILAAWHEHLVLLFRGQQLTELEQIEFAKQFGPLAKRARAKELRADAGQNQFPDITMLVTNIRENGKLIGSLPDGEVHFHTDQCFDKIPPAGTVLYAIEVPSVGGDTVFANMYDVYDALPVDIKTLIDDKSALTVYAYGGAVRNLKAVNMNDEKSAVHPLVRTHPDTKRNLLFANRLNSIRIEELSEDESNRVLHFCFDLIQQPRFHYAHKWRVGDLLLWDNRSAQHARTDFNSSERRLMRRCVIQGCGDVPTNRLRKFSGAAIPAAQPIPAGPA